MVIMFVSFRFSSKSKAIEAIHYLPVLQWVNPKTFDNCTGYPKIIKILCPISYDLTVFFLVFFFNGKEKEQNSQSYLPGKTSDHLHIN